MPTAVDYVLEGLAKFLEAERERGVRTVEFDCAFLKTLPERRAEPVVAAPPPSAAAPAPAEERRSYDFVFLHHAALDARGIEMMAKIVGALGKTADEAPILFTGERPAAKACVVLGSRALAKWFPELRGAPGQWLRAEDGTEVLVTHSPQYILDFGTVTPAVMEIKRKMWTAIKGVLKRI